MLLEERISKDNQAISRRANELGLKLRDVRFFDWNPMFVIMLYEEMPEQKLARETAEVKARSLAKTG